MSTHSRTLASGAGWRVSRFLCTAGPQDRPFEEQHASVCVAAVTHGTFRYRSSRGSALLAPGALLLGNPCTCYECSHEHGTGDECLAFHFAPDNWEGIVAAVPGARAATFDAPRLPPLPQLMPLLTEAEGAAGTGAAAELEELSLRLAGAVMTLLADRPGSGRDPTARDERRISEALRCVEARAHEPENVSLEALARDAAMSPYHFLRTFRRVVGMTPHQFVLRTRLHRAALKVRQSDDPITSIAFDAGFNDLSTFNRHFRRAMGVSPGAYRARRVSRRMAA
ncbi:AraC family transcriptional regulator [Chelativorans sp.]|uniref:AraC family transcriptional regulator n=1 Tax=Chelativorans sp. TaxID=2203393 RepID=UPI002811BA53|nr:AraC family transcriptional regulator [Chelativorans sp.]